MTPAPETDGEGTPEHPGPVDGDASASDYPVVLSLDGCPCLVVGGGPVAARKARGLVEAGAVVTVVTRRSSPTMEALVGAVRFVVELRPYREGEAAGYDLVVTATGDPTVDRRVVADAVAAGVLVNSADGDRPGTVRLPAVIRRGAVTVAVSTGGTTPALARWVRDRIAEALPAQLGAVATLVEEARAEVRAAGRATDSVDWSGLLDLVVLPLVEAGRVDEARAALRDAWDAPDRAPRAEPGGSPRSGEDRSGEGR